ncbi:TetR/AcrR family transcriptional regulator [Nocardia cerradoensis]|uniref:Putative HTH-type transcriptional regulator n=1 Tax=Nocardia cerradoensis TaxID=85688 RepID=A0A231HAY9_9NOCA|nr:TetR/AcrR family transcriptional regulator [Nocardia cerradoensis]NKY42969.1 TetR/AcrR family transcriptional regulator [Nocardia cerradoensis]OXR45999.1 putative HTH-type transcriptional regulator [Nocardia cerradoensis]
MSTPRSRARARTMDEIVRIGREHLAVHGAAALSLRAVARDLGVVSSAVYRYVRSRDELLTMLVVDGYTELADAVDAALAAAPADGATRLRVLAHAVRDWALAEPARYGLLFGTPVPGYDAPAQETTAPGTRVIGSLLNIVETACRTGELATPDPIPAVPAELAADIERIRAEFGLEMPNWAMARTLTVWTGLFGAVSFDVFDMYGAQTFTDRAQVFDVHLDTLCAILGFPAAAAD